MSNVSAINNIATQGSQALSKSKDTGSDLGKDAFLQLLVTQLKYQDPLDPASNEEFLAQMAQFSALEQMQNLNASFEKYQAFTMIGKDVVASTKDASGKVTIITGKVDAVQIKSGSPYLSVNGSLLPISSIQAIMDEGVKLDLGDITEE